MKKYNIIVTSASGIEAITKNELRTLDIDNTAAINGKIAFEGTMEDIASCNMYLRTADKVLLQLDSFSATSFDELFDNTKSIPWEDFLHTDGQYLVNGKSSKSALFALSACQSIIKKAIIERLKERKKVSFFPENGVEYYIDFNLFEDVATISLNTSGQGLHKRGYRDISGTAPLRETLASAIILLSGWQGDTPLIDPFCGSGTIPIEAAMIARNIAPGINRSFVIENYSFFDKKIMDNVRQEAISKIMERDLRISGFDIDKRAITLSLYHSEKAGVGQNIHFQAQDVSKLSSRFSLGTLITNPPYGERLMDAASVALLYKSLGEATKNLDRWKFYILTSARDFERNFGKRATKNRKLYNATKECKLYIYT